MAYRETRRGDSFNSSRVEDLEPSELIDLYGVGIDTHSRFIQVCVLLRDGDELKRLEREFSVDWADLQAARSWVDSNLEASGIQPDPLHYCIESTGTYHMPVLLAWRGRPRIVNPLLASGTRRKTDVLDARLLAQQDITRMWPDSYVPDEAVQEVRVLMGERNRWMRRRLQARNRLNNVLLRFGHTVFAYASWGPYTRGVIEDLARGQTPEGPGICPQGVPESMRPVLQDLLDDQAHADKQVNHFLRASLSRARAEEWVLGTGECVNGKELLTLLQSVPGIGEVSALIWMMFVIWPGRFDNAKACVAYCGCDPSLKVSAGKVTSHTRRKGNAQMHHALIQAAGSLIARKKEPFGQWGHRLMKKHSRGGYKKACGAVARRLAQAMYYVHMRGEPFSYDQYTFWKAIDVPEVSLADMDLGRHRHVLKRLGLNNSVEISHAYQTTLSGEKGVGPKCLEAIEQWLKKHGQVSTSRGPSSDERKQKQQARLRNAFATQSYARPKRNTSPGGATMNTPQ